MFIFDFPGITQETANIAIAHIRRGLEVAFKRYPSLTGRVGLVKGSGGERVQLRYGDTAATRAVASHIFKQSFHPTDQEFGGAYDQSYKNLCTKGMPVSHWRSDHFCASPQGRLPKGHWLPAVTVQANFLLEGALVLVFAFQRPVVDDASIMMFLETLSAGARGDLDFQGNHNFGLFQIRFLSIVGPHLHIPLLEVHQILVLSLILVRCC